MFTNAPWMKALPMGLLLGLLAASTAMAPSEARASDGGTPQAPADDD